MLKRLEIVGFKSFAKKTVLDFGNSTTAIVGPNGSGKSNVAEAFRFALGEQSMKSMRGKRAEDLIWGGSHTTPRANRGSVAIIFDNSRLRVAGARPARQRPAVLLKLILTKSPLSARSFVTGQANTQSTALAFGSVILQSCSREPTSARRATTLFLKESRIGYCSPIRASVARCSRTRSG